MFPMLIPTMIATPMMVFNARALAYPVTVVCASPPFFTAACGLRGGKTYWQEIRNELPMTIYDLGCNSTVGLRRS